jgi:hypothetical protein
MMKRMNKRSSRFITSDPVGRELFGKYRSTQLMDVLKSFGCARPAKDEETTSRSDGDGDDDDAYGASPE